MTALGRSPPGISPSRCQSIRGCVRRAPLHSVALWCIAVGRLLFGRVDRAPAPGESWPSRNLRGHESASSWITLSFMDQYLCRRLMSRPKTGRSRPTTAPAPPATFRLVHIQIVGREQMTIAADIGYCHGPGDPSQGKAHDITFGCFKARPRYHDSLRRRPALPAEIPYEQPSARRPWRVIM